MRGSVGINLLAFEPEAAGFGDRGASGLVHGHAWHACGIVRWAVFKQVLALGLGGCGCAILLAVLSAIRLGRKCRGSRTTNTSVRRGSEGLNVTRAGAPHVGRGDARRRDLSRPQEGLGWRRVCPLAAHCDVARRGALFREVVLVLGLK